MEQPRPETTPNPKADTPTPPRIYVASLSDYNAGILHGAWIDATQEPDDIHHNIQQMLDASRQPLAEEWAIHDHEGFEPARVSEYASIDSVARIAQGILEHGDAFAAWATLADDLGDESPDRFDEAYLGRWDSMHAYAEHYAADIGLTDDLVPEWAQPYVRVDIELLARDLDIELVTADAQEGGIHVFNPHV